MSDNAIRNSFPAYMDLPPVLRGLADLPIWLPWINIPGKGGKMRKIPADRGGNPAGYNQPELWDTYEGWKKGSIDPRPASIYQGPAISGVALGALRSGGGPDLIMLDIDDCIGEVDGVLAVAPWAIDLMMRCNSYVELSPSGTGLRILGGAAGWPTDETKRVWQLRHMVDDPVHGMVPRAYGGGEIYYANGFCTITANAYPGGWGEMWNDQLGSVLAGLERAVPDLWTGEEKDKGENAEVDPHAPIDLIRETLDFIPNDDRQGGECVDWETYKIVAMAVWRATDGRVEGLEVFRAWASQCSYHETGRGHTGPEPADEVWQHIGRSPPDALGYGKLWYLAKTYQGRLGNLDWNGGPKHKAHIEFRKMLNMKVTAVPRVTGEQQPGLTEELEMVAVADAAGSQTEAAPSTDPSGLATAAVNTSDSVNMVLDGKTRPVAAAAQTRFSDGALVDLMASLFGDKLRYCAAFGKWFEWSTIPEGGGRWKQLDNGEQEQYVKFVIRFRSAGLPPRVQAALDSSRTYDAVEKRARNHPAFAIDASEWDRDPMLLGVRNGVVDLRTGQLMAARPEYHMRAMTTVSLEAGGGEGAPTGLLAFLDKMMGHDKAMEAYLRRWGGYCLTGSTDAQTFVFNYGDGNNGKSTYDMIMYLILGNEYARIVDADMFMETRNPGHPTEMMQLEGARLILTSEIPQNKQWNIKRLKDLTSGLPISARFMGKDFSTFTFNGKVVLSGNFKPRIQSADVATKRRLDLVHWPVKLEKHEVIPGFAEKLVAAEGSKILRWLVDGCVEWWVNGASKEALGAPQAVLEATADYFDVQDIYTEWLQECCVDRRGEGNLTGEKVVNLWNSWRVHAERCNESAGRKRDLENWLSSQKWKIVKDVRDQKLVIGLNLKQAGNGDVALPRSALTVVVENPENKET